MMDDEESDEEEEEEEMTIRDAAQPFWTKLEKLLADRSLDQISMTERDQLFESVLPDLQQLPQMNVAGTPLGRTESAFPDQDSPLLVVNEQISYDVREVLGLGSMGTKVFRGTWGQPGHKGRRREVPAAIKRVDRSFTSSRGKSARCRPTPTRMWWSCLETTRTAPTWCW